MIDGGMGPGYDLKKPGEFVCWVRSPDFQVWNRKIHFRIIWIWFFRYILGTKQHYLPIL
jgi:hypothetical protein